MTLKFLERIKIIIPNKELETDWTDFNLEEYAHEMSEAHKEAFFCGRTSTSFRIDPIDGPVDDWPKVLDRFKEGEKGSSDILGWPCGLITIRARYLPQILDFVEWHAEFHRARKYIISNFNKGDAIETVTRVDKINDAAREASKR